MKLLMAYKNGTSDEFAEAQLDCSEKTLRGHASVLIHAWKERKTGIYLLDCYNAIVLDDVLSVRVMP